MAAPFIALTLYDNPGAPAVFVDEAVGLNLSQGVLHLTFARLHSDHRAGGDPPSRHVNLRVMIPLASAARLGEALTKYAAEKAETKGE